MKHTLASLALITAAAGAQAALVNHADVNGFRTFEDTTTGAIWADLDNWLAARDPANPGAVVQYGTYASYAAALASAGFTWADPTTVDAMLGGAGFSAATWNALLGAVNTEWGNTLERIAGYSDDFGVMHVHEFNWAGGPVLSGYVPAGGNPVAITQARGLWAYMPAQGGGGGSATVPEPATLALAGLALAAAAALGRRRGF